MSLRLFLIGAFLLATGAVLAAPALARPAQAQEPTPTVVTDLGLNTDAVFGLIGPNPVIRWRPLAGAASYRVTASLSAIRVNRADPFCSPPAQSDAKSIAIDQTLDGAATELPVDFPVLPESDAWFAFTTQVGLLAFDANGRESGNQSRGGGAEATCAGQPEAQAGSMTVTALVPAPPGTGVRLEALDPATIQSVLCASARSTAETGDATGGTTSRVTFVVDRAACVSRYSGNLRICWSATACSVFEYQDGLSKDLGLLSTAVTYSPPSVGDGAPAAGGRPWPWRAPIASGLLALVGLTLGGLGLLRRRTNTPRADR